MKKYFYIQSLRFLKNESGQGLVEYIVILASTVIFFILLMRQLIRPAFEKINNLVTQLIEKSLFGADFHVFKIKR